VQGSSRLEYRETVPGAWWRQYELAVGTEHLWNLAGDREQLLGAASASITWPNFWETDAEFAHSFRAYDPRLTRGGPLMRIPRNWRAAIDVENSNAARTRTELSLLYGRDENGGLTFQGRTELAMQPGSQWQLSIAPRYERLVDTQQYVTTIARGPLAADATFGNRYVFGNIDRSTYSTAVRFNYTFKPDLTLDLYAEPFAASGRYVSFGELADSRTLLLRRYGSDGTMVTAVADGSLRVADGGDTVLLRSRDFNVRSFRSNLVLRWEWRPGSMLYVVWQQDRGADDITGRRVSFSDMLRSVRTPGDNFFAIKASLWMSPR